MNAPKLSFNSENKLCVEGDFEFTTSSSIYDPADQKAYKNITFSISPECPADLSQYSASELNEMIAEKLKQDFIVFLSKPL